MSSSDYERGYSAGYHAAERKYKSKNIESVKVTNVTLTVKEQAYVACQAAVDECHRLEQELCFPMWAEGIPQEQWPSEYVQARENWDRLREERNRIYAA